MYYPPITLILLVLTPPSQPDTIFGAETFTGSIILNPTEEYQVYFLSSLIKTTSDLLTIKKLSTDAHTSLQSALSTFTATKLSSHQNQQYFVNCLFAPDSVSPKQDCINIKQADFISNKITKYLDYLKSIDLAIQVKLAKVELLLPQSTWQHLSDNIVISQPPNLHLFSNSIRVPGKTNEVNSSVDATPKSDTPTTTAQPTTQRESQNDDKDELHSETESPSVHSDEETIPPFSINLTNPNIAISAVPFSDSSLQKFIYKNDNFFHDALTLNLDTAHVHLTIASMQKIILVDITDFFIRSPETRLKTLSDTVRTLPVILQQSWTTSLESLQNFLNKPTFMTLETILTSLQEILNILAMQIHTFQEIHILNPKHSNNLLAAIMLDIAHAITAVQPHLQNFQHLVRPFATALLDPSIEIYTNQHFPGSYPTIQFNTHGYYPATVVNIKPFTVKELNQRFILDALPTGSSVLWTENAVTYLAAVTLQFNADSDDSSFNPPMHSLNRLTLESTPAVILDQHILTCLTSIKVRRIPQAIKYCNLSLSEPFYNNLEILDDILYFTFQRIEALSLVCRCEGSYVWLDFELIGSGYLAIPENCRYYPNSSTTRDSQLSLSINPSTHNVCTVPQILERVMYDRTFPSINHLVSFITKNPILDKGNLKFAVDNLIRIAASSTNKSTINEAISIILKANQLLQDSTFQKIFNWFKVPTNAITATLSTLSIIIWIILLFRCNIHHCDPHTIDCEEEMIEIQNHVKNAYSAYSQTTCLLQEVLPSDEA